MFAQAFRKSGVARTPKPYRVEWIGEPGVAVASFATLREAVAHIDTLSLDQQHVVIYRRNVVWPSNVRRDIGTFTCAATRL